MRRFALRKVSQVMNTRPQKFSANDKVSSLIGCLREAEVREAVIEYGHRLGVVTLDDLLNVSNPERVALGRVASSAIPVSPEASLLTAADLMLTNRVWVLLVKRGNELLGTISQREIVKVMPMFSTLSNISCGDLMRKNVGFIHLHDKLSTARKKMRKRGVSHLIVVDDEGELRGVVTAKEIVLGLLQPGESRTIGERGGEFIKIWDLPVKSIMDETPLVFKSGEPASHALNAIKKSRKDICVVKSDSRPLGIITPRELISVLLRFKIREEPRIYVVGLPDLEDPSVLEVVQSKLSRVMSRGFGVHRGIDEVMLDVKRMKRSGKRTLYVITARVYMPKNLLTISAEGWDLMEAFDNLCRKLGRRFSKEKTRKPSRFLRI